VKDSSPQCNILCFALSTVCSTIALLLNSIAYTFYKVSTLACMLHHVLHNKVEWYELLTCNKMTLELFLIRSNFWQGCCIWLRLHPVPKIVLDVPVARFSNHQNWFLCLAGAQCSNSAPGQALRLCLILFMLSTNVIDMDWISLNKNLIAKGASRLIILDSDAGFSSGFLSCDVIYDF
jgi:hypothetical protein